MLGGTEGALLPFWSPDGRSVGFFASGALKRVAISGGPPQLVALGPADYRSTLRRCRDAGIGGGAVYDALIASCARKARVATLVTWDVGAFERFLDDEPAVRTPVTWDVGASSVSWREPAVRTPETR